MCGVQARASARKFNLFWRGMARQATNLLRFLAGATNVHRLKTGAKQLLRLRMAGRGEQHLQLIPSLELVFVF